MKLIELHALEGNKYKITLEVSDPTQLRTLINASVPTGEPKAALAAAAPTPAAAKPAAAAPQAPATAAAKPAPTANGAPKANGAPAAAKAAAPAAKLKAAPVVADDEEEAEEGAGEGLPAEVAEAKRLIDVLNYFQDQGVSGADALVAALTEHRSRIGLIGRIPADLLVERVERALATFGR